MRQACTVKRYLWLPWVVSRNFRQHRLTTDLVERVHTKQNQSSLQELNDFKGTAYLNSQKCLFYADRGQTYRVLLVRKTEAKSSGSAVPQVYVFQVADCFCEHRSATTKSFAVVPSIGFASWLTHFFFWHIFSNKVQSTAGIPGWVIFRNTVVLRTIHKLHLMNT